MSKAKSTDLAYRLMADWQPDSSLSTLRARARLNQQVRAFFLQRGVLEVETPALSRSGNTDPVIDSFSVAASGGLRYLHTSPEYPMKRLLAAGSGDIYQICKVWRQDEAGSRHNPEFTLLEYYRVGFSWQRLMQEVGELLHELLPGLSAPALFTSYRACFLETLGIDPHIVPVQRLIHCANERGIDSASRLSRQQWLDLLFTHVIEAGFATDRLTFVYHYPAEQSALACVSEHEGVAVAERFEVYCGAMELGNGYQELTDGEANSAKLQRDAELRSAAGLTSPDIDQRFISAMHEGMPSAAGVAIGLDRVLLCRTGEKSLNRVISFAWELA